MLPEEAVFLLKQVREERKRGATWCAMMATRAIKAAAKADPGPEDLALLSKLIEEANPSMAILKNVAEAVRRLAADPGGLRLARLASGLENYIAESSRSASVALARHLEQYSSVVTLSYSSIVADALARIPGTRVFVAESRPAMEGVDLARFLRERGVDAILVTDGALGHAVRWADAAVVGADAIVVPGEIVNKTGTYLLALVSREEGKPFIAAGQAAKIVLHRPPLLEDTWEEHGLPSRTVLFDTTPSHLVDLTVLENGEHRPPFAGTLLRAREMFFRRIVS